MWVCLPTTMSQFIHLKWEGNVSSLPGENGFCNPELRYSMCVCVCVVVVGGVYCICICPSYSHVFCRQVWSMWDLRGEGWSKMGEEHESCKELREAEEEWKRWRNLKRRRKQTTTNNRRNRRRYKKRRGAPCNNVACSMVSTSTGEINAGLKLGVCVCVCVHYLQCECSSSLFQLLQGQLQHRGINQNNHTHTHTRWQQMWKEDCIRRNFKGK